MPPLAKFRTFNKPFVFNLQKKPVCGPSTITSSGGRLLGRRTAQLGANLAVRTLGHLDWTMCHVIVFLAPGPKLGRQTRRNLELNTVPEVAPACLLYTSPSPRD